MVKSSCEKKSIENNLWVRNFQSICTLYTGDKNIMIKNVFLSNTFNISELTNRSRQALVTQFRLGYSWVRIAKDLHVGQLVWWRNHSSMQSW